MRIDMEGNSHLELLDGHHANAIFLLAKEDKEYLAEWLPWLNKMDSEEFIVHFIKGAKERNAEGTEFAFAIIENKKLVGRVGIYKIDYQHLIGEIGYWIGKDFQGKGLVTKACHALINYGFDELKLNRIEIRCATQNLPSNKIPRNLNFTHEGIIRNGEFLNGKFNDINLFSLLKSDIR